MSSKSSYKRKKDKISANNNFVHNTIIFLKKEGSNMKIDEDNIPITPE